MEIHFKILRYDPEVDHPPYFQDYVVAAKPEERLLDCLNRVQGEQDATLAYRKSCGHGVCGSDAMKINGKCRLACQELVKNYVNNEVVVEPLPGYRVQKDLMVDLEPFFEKVNLVRPYLIAPEASLSEERRQAPEDRKKVDHVIRCILCACCTASCPVVLENEAFLGPAPLVWAFRRVFDTRDENRVERLRSLDSPEGAWGCENHFECTRMCPKEIPVTKSINQLKREIQQVLSQPEGSS